MKNYYIGCHDYFGENKKPDEIFNNELVPFLEKLKISESDIDKIAEMVSEIAEEAWMNGSDNARCEIDD